MISMRHHSVGAAIAAALIAAPAIAADWGDSGGWDVVQAPNYCTLMKAYDSPGATELMLTLRVDGTVGLSLTNTNWSARRDGRYEMSFAIDEAEFGGGAVVGFQASRGRRGVVTTMPPAFLPKFAAGDRMLIYKDGETVEERGVLQPAAIVGLEQVAQHHAAGLLVSRDADELGAAIGGAHRALSQHAPDLVGLLVGLAGERLPDLLLARMVVRHGEGHQEIERDPVLGVEVEELRADRREPQALLHHRGRDEEARGDLLLGLALLAQGLEGAELVERVQVDAPDVLG